VISITIEELRILVTFDTHRSRKTCTDNSIVLSRLHSQIELSRNLLVEHMLLCEARDR